MRAPGAARKVFQLFTSCPGGGWVGVIDEIKAVLSPAWTWLWAELGKSGKNSNDRAKYQKIHNSKCRLFEMRG